MFELIFTSVAAEVPLKFGSTVLGILVALLLGLVISIVYLTITHGDDRSPNFALSLVILPTIISVVILLIGGSIARAFSMAGVFALIRFRSVPGDSKDISFVFISMAVGLATGMGFITLAAGITALLCLVLIVVSKMGFGVIKRNEKRLRITIPEDLNYQGAFDDLFKKYTKKCEMQKVRTANLGTLFELTYKIAFKEDISEKEFIDELRCRNGNLNIQLDIMEQRSIQQL